jgi:hypothetical protein
LIKKNKKRLGYIKNLLYIYYVMIEKLKPLIVMLQNKDILNFGPIGGWFPYEENMSGTLGWYHIDDVERDRILYATPHWEEDFVVPVGISFSDGDYEDVTSFELSQREPVEYQLNQYISIISVILSNLK